jgi:hypothetical protein
MRECLSRRGLEGGWLTGTPLWHTALVMRSIDIGQFLQRTTNADPILELEVDRIKRLWEGPSYRHSRPKDTGFDTETSNSARDTGKAHRIRLRSLWLTTANPSEDIMKQNNIPMYDLARWTGQSVYLLKTIC